MLKKDDIILIDSGWSREAGYLRNVLSRNFVSYRFLDIKEKEARKMLRGTGLKQNELPVLLFSDGSYLVKPDAEKMAEKIGRNKFTRRTVYDLVIIGSGPAGLTAAVYGGSEGLSTLLIECESLGGQAGDSAKIDNYLGFPRGIRGRELIQRAYRQICRFGVELLIPQRAAGISRQGTSHVIRLKDGTAVAGKTVLISSGVSYNKLNVPGIERFEWSGVYYGAAVSEAATCYKRNIYIVGGGNSAGQAAVFLSRVASKITMLVRGPSLDETMSSYLIYEIKKRKNISLEFGVNITKAEGNTHLEEITYTDKSGRKKTVRTPVLFIYIGARPTTAWISDEIIKDEKGYLVANMASPDIRTDTGPGGKRSPFLLETSLPGVFAAGDVRFQSVKRIASAVGEGAMAIQSIHSYLTMQE